MVRFRAQGGHYVVPVEDVRQVRTADNVSLLPLGREGVAGLVMHGNVALPVLSVLGSDGDRLIVLEVDGRRFGLLVEEVSGVADVDERRLGPAPEGQASMLITGVLDSEQDIALVIDAGVLAHQVLDTPLPGPPATE
jgi:chemotaxis signal transduction protein